MPLLTELPVLKYLDASGFPEQVHQALGYCVSEAPFREMLPSSRGEQDCPHLLHPAPGGALPFPLASIKLQKCWSFPSWGQCHMRRSLDSIQRRSDSCWWPMISAFLGIQNRHKTGFFLSFWPILPSQKPHGFLLFEAQCPRGFMSLCYFPENSAQLFASLPRNSNGKENLPMLSIV